jgi:hypothetical protein
MTTGFGFQDGAPDERILAYFAERTGGVGMAVVAELCRVSSWATVGGRSRRG